MCICMTTICEVTIVVHITVAHGVSQRNKALVILSDRKIRLARDLTPNCNSIVLVLTVSFQNLTDCSTNSLIYTTKHKLQHL